MPLEPIRIQSDQDFSRLLRKNFSLSCSQLSAQIIAKHYVVANDGNTYFIPDLLQLSAEEVQQSSLTFTTREGDILSLATVLEQRLEDNLIHNLPLIQFLLKIDVWDYSKSELLYSNLNRVLPILHPVITPYEDTFEQMDIESWLGFLKQKNIPLTTPLKENQPLKSRHLIPNLALEDLIWFSYLNAEILSEKLRAVEAQSVEEARLKKITLMRESIKDRLLASQYSLLNRITVLENSCKSKETRIKNDVQLALYAQSLQQTSRAALKESNKQLEIDKKMLLAKGEKIITISQKTAAIFFFMLILALLPLTMLGIMAFGIFIAGIALVYTGAYVGIRMNQNMRDKATCLALKQFVIEFKCLSNRLPPLTRQHKNVSEKLAVLNNNTQRNKPVTKPRNKPNQLPFFFHNTRRRTNPVVHSHTLTKTF